MLMKKTKKEDKYELLKIYSYMHPGEPIDKEYDKRFNSRGTRRFSLMINPIEKKEGETVKCSDRFELFLVPIDKYESLLNSIRNNSFKIKKLIAKLPGIASDKFFDQILFNEIKGTNDIENVASTTEEINKAIDNKDNDDKKIRFKSFAKMYFSIKEGKVNRINKLQDVRDLYDFLLEGEIPKKKLPDGKLFRAGFVRIGTSTKTVHFPEASEQGIDEQLNNWIMFINEDKYDSILKACVAHYYFEYIHPFYDGNGRLGRYIFCSYIGKKLDPYTALSFSYQVNLKKINYYKGFEEVENKKNKGELTFFVITLLKYLVSGQKYVLQELETSKAVLDFIGDKLAQSKFSDFESSVLFVYSQVFFFNSTDRDIKDDEMINVIAEDDELRLEVNKGKKYSKKSIRNQLDELENQGYIERVKNRPIKRKLTTKFFNEIDFDI